MKIFYHNDADGKCAGYMLWEMLRSLDGGAEFVEMDYNKVFPLGDVYLDERIWIVDFSIEPDMMRALLKVTKDVTWVDHHVSSLEKYNGFESEIVGLRSVDYSGCELTWLHLHEGLSGHNVEIKDEAIELVPMYARLIGDRDTWTFKFGDTSRYMHEAFKAAGEPGPKRRWWDNISEGVGLSWELDKGKTLKDHTKVIYGAMVERAAYETVMEGHRILVCNCPFFTSEIFGDRIKDYDFVAVYWHNGVTWKVSLYSEKMDVLEFAKKRGGGGHPRACGFVASGNDIPFELK